MIESYVEAMDAGAKFPAVDVFYDGTNYWLADGFHRIKAAFGGGSDEIEARIHQGTVEEAQWFSFAANKSNGLYRSNADKQRCVLAALKHPKSVNLSDKQIAEHVGVDCKTVARYRPELTMELPQSIRTGRDGRTINTANIGKARREPPAAVAEREVYVPLEVYVPPDRAYFAPPLPELTVRKDDQYLEDFVEVCRVVVSFKGQGIDFSALRPEEKKVIREAHEFIQRIVS